MITILIMEDREEKIESLKSLLIDECEIPNDSIHVARTIYEGRRLLRENLYDLLLLDMILPSKEGQEPNEEDSPRFIDEIYSNPNLKIPNQIVGETSHDEKFDELKSKFEDKLWSLVRYQENSTDWKTKIKNKVFHLLKNIDQIRNSLIQAKHYDLCIICALREEFEALISVFGGFEKWKKHQNPDFPLPYHTCQVSTSTIGKSYSICAVCIGKAGMVPTSVYATAMYQVFTPDCIFMTGFSAGLKIQNQNPGDIIIAKSVQDYSRGKLTQEPTGTINFLREIHQITVDPRLQYAAEELAANISQMSHINVSLRKFNILEKSEPDVKSFVAPTICGPFVMASEELIDDINSIDRNLMALDMEGFGLYAAAQAMGKSCLWIKGVADFGDSKKIDKYHKIASYSSALFLQSLIKECLA